MNKSAWNEVNGFTNLGSSDACVMSRNAPKHKWPVCEELFVMNYYIIVHILYYVIDLINGIRELYQGYAQIY